MVSERSNGHSQRVRCVSLNRPEKRNALNLDTLHQLLRAVREPGCDQIVLAGHGPVFCSGLDLSECANGAVEHLDLLREVYAALLAAEARTIAVVQGFAMGGGVGLAACADFVVAGAGARFRIPQGELAAMARIVVPVVVGRQAFYGNFSPWFAGEIDAMRAREIGLVNRIVADIDLPGVAHQSFPELATWRTPQRRAEIMAGIDSVLAGLRQH